MVPPTLPRRRRRYIDGPFGQIHVRLADPANGSSGRPVVAFHQSPNSGQIFNLFQNEMGRDRVVAAPDTPGFGLSDRPKEPPSIEDYARGLMPVLHSIPGPVDLVGYHTGATIAVAAALSDPDKIGRLFLVGIPIFRQPEVDGFFAEPWPKPQAEDGSHISEEWQRSWKWRGPGQTVDQVVGGFVAKLQAGNHAWWGARAVFKYDFAGALTKLRQPALAANPRDDLWEISPRLREIRPDIELIDLPEFGFGVFEAGAELMATTARRFLDGES